MYIYIYIPCGLFYVFLLRYTRSEGQELLFISKVSPCSLPMALFLDGEIDIPIRCERGKQD